MGFLSPFVCLYAREWETRYVVGRERLMVFNWYGVSDLILFS